MIEEGQVVLFRFPQTDLKQGKMRPALVLRRLPGSYDDWLICMISSRLYQVQPIDDVISVNDEDFSDSGLKRESVVRTSRLAVVEKNMLEGAIGRISSSRLRRIREKIADWIQNEST